MPIIVRPATLADADLVMEFNRLLARESEGKELEEALLALGVKAGLADPHKCRYFLAEEEKAILGQLAITSEWSDWRNGWFWWIQSVYVRVEQRQRGVFRALFEHVQKTAREDPEVIGLRLYVEGNNHPAQQVYLKVGLDWTGYQVLEKYPL